MAENHQIDDDTRTDSDPDLDLSATCPKGWTNGRKWLRKQSMPIQLPSIYEQECLKRRNSSLKSVEEQSTMDISDAASRDQTDSVTERRNSGFENDKRHQYIRKTGGTSDLEGPRGLYKRNRSHSVDLGQVLFGGKHSVALGQDLTGGKHTRIRGDARANKTEKLRQRLDEMERTFSKSTLIEIEKLRNLQMYDTTE